MLLCDTRHILLIDLLIWLPNIDRLHKPEAAPVVGLQKLERIVEIRTNVLYSLARIYAERNTFNDLTVYY